MNALDKNIIHTFDLTEQEIQYIRRVSWQFWRDDFSWSQLTSECPVEYLEGVAELAFMTGIQYEMAAFLGADGGIHSQPEPVVVECPWASLVELQARVHQIWFQFHSSEVISS